MSDSDADSDVTIEPDPKDWETTDLFEPSPPKPNIQRHITCHSLSDSDDDEQNHSTTRNSETSDFSRNSPKLLKRIPKVDKNKQILVRNKSSEELEVKNFNFSAKTSSLVKKKLSNSEKETTASCSKYIEISPVQNLKRKHSMPDEAEDTSLPMCKYGSQCYRKNPEHFKEYRHPKSNGRTANLSSASGGTDPPLKRQRTQGVPFTSTVPVDVYKNAQPISFFLTKVKGIASGYNHAFTMDIKDILSTSMGNLQASCQFNYMFDIPWLLQQYPSVFREKSLLCVHGFQGAQKARLEADAKKYTNIKFCQARLEMAYGTHHTKMMLLLYDEGLRVVIHTANLIEQDWYQKTQGIWISPVFPKLKGGPSSTLGDSNTHFKKHLLEYLSAYKAYQLQEWKEHITRSDMSSANVFIVGSVPGRHTAERKHSFGHMKLRKLLNDHGPSKDCVSGWPVIGQFSSVGSLGPNKESWLCVEFLQSLATVKSTSSVPLSSVKLKLIFPTKDNVRTSLEGFPAGASIPYSINVAKKQPYLHSFFYQWKSEGRGRTRAMPHIKSYCRPSPSWEETGWFLVTSANLSKAAWGALEKKGSQLMIRSYEIGVLFLPAYTIDESVFKCTSKHSNQHDNKWLLLPYDFPLVPYQKDDRPWIWDIPYKDLPDTNGNMWCPS